MNDSKKNPWRKENYKKELERERRSYQEREREKESMKGEELIIFFGYSFGGLLGEFSN